MHIYELAAAFGGGVFGAAVGPRPAFILASFLAIAAGILSFGGVDPSTSASVVAFGSFLGPHIAYAGGVAAVAFAKRKGAIENGADVGTPMHLLRDPSVMLVGGLFGVVGCVLEWFFTAICRLDGSLYARMETDVIAVSVITSALLVRFLIGKSGLFGCYRGEAPRQWVPKGRELTYLLVLGAGLGVMVSGVGLYLRTLGVSTEYYATLAFGIAGIGLIFEQTGSAYPPCHHITILAATAALCSGSLVAGTVFGAIAAVLFDVNLRTFNSYADSSIDPPGVTIIFLTFLIHLIWG